MRKRKIIRGAFYSNTGVTSAFTAGSITLSSVTSDWWITYSLSGQYWKIAPTGTTNATTGPIIVDSTTTSITVTPSAVTMATGATQQLAVLNQSSLNVITECTFSSAFTGATVSTGGLITTIHGATGAGVITTTHNDGPTGATTVTIG